MNTWKYHLFCPDNFDLAPKLFYKVYPAYHVLSFASNSLLTICYCIFQNFPSLCKSANLPLPSYLWTSGVAPQPPAVAAGLNSVPAARRVKRQSCAHTFERLRDWRQTGRGFVIILAADRGRVGESKCIGHSHPQQWTLPVHKNYSHYWCQESNFKRYHFKFSLKRYEILISYHHF